MDEQGIETCHTNFGYQMDCYSAFYVTVLFERSRYTRLLFYSIAASESGNACFTPLSSLYDTEMN